MSVDQAAPTAQTTRRKFTQTLTLQVEFWGTGDNLDEAPQSWEWFRACDVGDLYDATVEAAGPVQLVDRHDYELRYAGGPTGGSIWEVMDTEGDELWRARFRGTHSEAVAWVADRGGVVRR